MRFAPEYVTHVLTDNFEDAKTYLLAPLMSIHYAHLVMLTEQGIVSRDESGRASAIPPRRLARFGPSGLERWIDWRPYGRRGFTWPIQSKRGCAVQCT